MCGDGAGALQSLQPAVRVRGLGVEMMMPARCSRCSRLSPSGKENSGRCRRRLVAVVERIVGGPEGHAVLSPHRALFCSLLDSTLSLSKRRTHYPLVVGTLTAYPVIEGIIDDNVVY